MDKKKDQEPRISFGKEAEDDAKEQLGRRGALKVNAAKSQFAKDPEVKKEEFEKRADDVISKIENRKERAVLLSKKFYSIARDTKVESQRGPMEISIEKETVRNLIEFATEMNNDPTEPESSGSIAVITLLIKVMFFYRDKSNDLSHKVSQLEHKVAQMMSSVSGSKDVK